MMANNFLSREKTESNVSNLTFYIYLIYVISFFLHLAARIPGISIVRPDLLLAVVIMIMLFIEKDKLKGRYDNPCSRYLWIFSLYIILSLPFVLWPGSVLRENLADFIKASLFFHFTVLIIDTDYKLKRFVLVFITCQLFRVLEPLYLHEMYGYWGEHTYLGDGDFANRLSGAPSDVISANELGFIIATLFPFLHYLWGSSRWHAKLSYLALIPTLLYALVLTMSRSGLVATLVIGWTIFAKSRHKVILILIGIFIAITAWINMTDMQKDRYLSMSGDSDTRNARTFHGRINGVQTEFKLALQHPIVGTGIGTSKEAIYNFLGGRNVSHNLYTETFMETGIIGLFIYLLFIKRIFETLKNTSDNLSQCSKLHENHTAAETNIRIYNKNLLMALFSCLWMYVIFSVAQYGLSFYHWYLLAGLATVLNRNTQCKTKDRITQNQKDPKK